MGCASAANTLHSVRAKRAHMNEQNDLTSSLSDALQAAHLRQLLDLSGEANAAVLVAHRALRRVFEYKELHGNLLHDLPEDDCRRHEGIDYGLIVDLEVILGLTIRQP